MWQSKREISRECNHIIGSAKGSQISEKYWGEVGKGKRVDVYLEVRKRRGHIFFEWNKCLCTSRYKKAEFILFSAFLILVQHTEAKLRFICYFVGDRPVHKLPWTICYIILNTCKSVRQYVFCYCISKTKKTSSDKIRKKTLHWPGPVNIIVKYNIYIIMWSCPGNMPILPRSDRHINRPKGSV